MAYDRPMPRARWFRTELERFADRLVAQVAELGWTIGNADGWSALYGGTDGRGEAFSIRAIYGETSDVLEWRGGPLRLDELVGAVANVPTGDRAWVRGVEVSEGLAASELDGDALRSALNAKAAEGLSPAELNEYALELGAGGVTSLITRFERSAVEAEPEIDGLTVLATNPDAAARLLTDEARERIAALAAQAVWPGGAPTFAAFAGVPFSKVRLDVPGTSLDLLQELAGLGSELRARAGAATTG
jgi:hypothetical protein